MAAEEAMVDTVVLFVLVEMDLEDRMEVVGRELLETWVRVVRGVSVREERAGVEGPAEAVTMDSRRRTMVGNTTMPASNRLLEKLYYY